MSAAAAAEGKGEEGRAVKATFQPQRSQPEGRISPRRFLLPSLEQQITRSSSDRSETWERETRANIFTHTTIMFQLLHAVGS